MEAFVAIRDHSHCLALPHFEYGQLEGKGSGFFISCWSEAPKHRYLSSLLPPSVQFCALQPVCLNPPQAPLIGKWCIPLAPVGVWAPGIGDSRFRSPDIVRTPEVAKSLLPPLFSNDGIPLDFRHPDDVWGPEWGGLYI